MLKKVVFVLRKENAAAEMRELLREITGRGIGVCLVKDGDNVVNDAVKDMVKDTVKYTEDNILVKKGQLCDMCIEKGEEGTLYVTDYADCQKELKSMGVPVVIYLHEDNREEKFAFAEYAIENLAEVEFRSLEMAWRRLTGKPWMITETKRCVIRETVVEDVDSFYEIYKEPLITEYMEDLYEDRAEEIAYIEDYIKNVYGFYGYGMWTVLEKESGKVIGRAGLSLREGYDIPELGFVIGVPWQGQGYANEVCQAILKYGKEELGFTCFQALVMRGNHKSVALCEKLGFTYRETVEIDGGVYERMVK